MLERVFQEPKFRVLCLGRFKLVEAGSGTDMTPANRKTRALVGYLCVVGRPVARERLASLLWGDRGDEQARASLRQAIYELRSMLAGDRLLKMERDTVAISDDVSTDVASILAAAQSRDLNELSRVLSEWRGDFFEDMPSVDESFDTWLRSERLRVQESLVTAAIEAARAGMAAGQIEAARKIVALLQQRDGTNEVVLRLGLELDHLAGDSSSLHRRYERFRDQLRAELDATPAAETQRLFHDLAGRTSAASIAFDSRNGTDSDRDYAQRTARSERSSAAPSVAEADVEAPVARGPPHSARSIRFAGAAVAVIAVCALVWAVWNPLHEGAQSTVHLGSNIANASTAERLLLAVDMHSEQNEGRVAAMESAAQTAAQRALVRDPNDGEALGVLAVLSPATHLQEIDRLFKRALRSEPNNAQLLNWHGRFLMAVGRAHDALKELTRAYEHEHAAPLIASNLALALLLTGRSEDAKGIIDLGRGKGFSSLRVKYFLYRRDWFGLANYLRTLPTDPLPERAAFFRLCSETAMAFVTHEADKFGPLRAGWRSHASVDPDDAVQSLSALGDEDGALEVVQSTARYRRHDDLLRGPGWEALFAPNLIALRRDPRVTALFAQWGLLDYWKTTGRRPDFMR